MIRLIGFLIKLAVVVALVVWLADQPGSAHIVWHDYVIDMSAAMLGIGVVALGFVFYLLFRLWHLLRYGPERWRLSRQLRKLRQGHDHLTHGFVAVAGGDAAEAGRLALAARKRLGHTTLTRLLQAQAAQLAGDFKAARGMYRALAEESSSAMLGYRGLIKEARRAGQTEEADRLAAEWRRVQPHAPWLHLFDFESATRRQDWETAHTALVNLIPARLMEPERFHRYRAALLLTQGQAAAKRGDHDAALAAAEQAAHHAPGWLPAIIALARAQAASGHRRGALRVIEKHWATIPHPHLAGLYRAAHDDATAAYRQMERLCSRIEDLAASRLALAEAALDANIWGEARRHLMALIGRGHAPAAAYRLMGKLERQETGNDFAARQWEAQAANAASDPAWYCPQCGGSQEEWEPACRHCGSFATLEWRAAPATGMVVKDEGTEI